MRKTEARQLKELAPAYVDLHEDRVIIRLMDAFNDPIIQQLAPAAGLVANECAGVVSVMFLVK